MNEMEIRAVKMEFVNRKNTSETDNLTNINPPYSKIEKMSVEEMAKLLKFGQLPDYKYNDTLDLLIIKLSQKAHQGWAFQRDVINVTFEETAGSEGVSGFITYKSIEFALRTYGKLDQKTGEVIPFEKLFWAAFGLKNQDIINEHFNNTRGEEQKARTEEVKQLVQRVAKRNNKQHLIPRISLLKKDNLKRVLEELGGTKEDLKVGEKLLEDNLVCRDICFDEKGDESGSYLSDAVSINAFHDADAALDMVISALKEAFALAKNEKELLTLRSVATLRIADYVPSGNYAAIADLDDFLDTELLKQIRITGRKDKELLMEYFQVKDRELRRRLSKAKELLDMGFDIALGRNTAA